MKRVLAASSIVAVVALTALVPGSGRASSVSGRLPAGLAAAIHARFGPGPLRAADSPTEHPFLGTAVVLSEDGTTALVSAPGAHNQNGAVYVYHAADAGSWTSTSTPAATLSGARVDSLGWGMALSADGTTAFVGTPFGAGGIGGVYVYHVASEDAWASTSTKTATLTGGTVGYFAASLAASSDGTTVVVSDPLYNDYAGGAVVYHVSGESAWASTSTPTAILSNAAEPRSDAYAGATVAISSDGTTVLLSDFASKKHAGGAYLFRATSEASWLSSSAPTAILSNASGAANDLLGAGLALSADATTAFLGAPGVNGSRGAVDVFHVADAGSWASSSAPAAILTKGGGAAKSYFGEFVAVSSDGATVMAAASGAHKSAGAVDIFHVSDESAWTTSGAPTAVLTDSVGVSGDTFGSRSVSIAPDGATAIIGANGTNWSTGKADVFHVADSGSWVTTSAPAARLTNSALPKPLCVVPRLLGDHRADLAFDLDLANCKLGKVKVVHSTKKHRKRVFWQSLRHGRHLPPGTKISVRIGK